MNFDRATLGTAPLSVVEDDRGAEDRGAEGRGGEGRGGEGRAERVVPEMGAVAGGRGLTGSVSSGAGGRSVSDLRDLSGNWFAASALATAGPLLGAASLDGPLLGAASLDGPSILSSLDE